MKNRLRVAVPALDVWVHAALLTGAVAFMALIVATPDLLSLAA